MQPSSPHPRKVCVIGAGPSGLAAVKALSDVGLDVDCYEKSDRVGGNWVFRNSNGVSSAYRSLHINTSKARSQFHEFPMPAAYPDYPRHDLMAQYFDAYADAFDLKRRIHFETSVEKAELLPDGTFGVQLGDGTSRQYRALIVANGHHATPRYPEPPIPGRFSGVAFHSHHYVDPTEPHDLRDKCVVVVGIGNSAVDIACELSHAGNARRVLLSMRRGAYILPKYLLGKPLDASISLPQWLPARRSMITWLFHLLVGRMERFGLPKPDHRLLEAHPTVSSELLTRLGSGDIVPKPAITELLPDGVRFADGTSENADAVIYSTGYHVSFPFFSPDFISVKDNDLRLFHRVVHPDVANLFFIGLCQPLGAIMPLAEVQSQWVAEHLTGGYRMPEKSETQQHIAQQHTTQTARYVASARHTLQVDVPEYLKALEQERRRGRSRAAKRVLSSER